MTNLAIESLNECDLILFLLDGTKEIGTGDIFVNENIRNSKTPTYVIINKIDKMSDEELNNKVEEIREN